MITVVKMNLKTNNKRRCRWLKCFIVLDLSLKHLNNGEVIASNQNLNRIFYKHRMLQLIVCSELT